jgi:hypothetical protein
MNEVASLMICVCEWPLQTIIGVLNVLKFDFVEVDESMFYDVVRPFQRIFYILVIQKGDLDEVVVVMF